MSATPITARRRLVAGAALALTVVMAAGCSSSNDQKSSAKHLKRAAATEHVAKEKKTPSTTAAPAASTTTAAPAAPECTVAAAQAAVGPQMTVEPGVTCLDGHLAGAYIFKESGVAAGMMLEAVDGHWATMSNQALSDFCTTITPSSPLYSGCMDN